MRNANGFGSVIKLSGKRRRPYAVRITAGWDGGRQIFKYVSYHEKKKDAMIALAEYNKNPYDIDASKITFKGVYERWSKEGFKELSDNAVRNYKSVYNRYCSSLYNKVFKELKKDHLQAVIDGIESPSMAKVTTFLLSKLYQYAMENEIVEKDYSKLVKKPKLPKAKEKIPFTKEEINLLWEKIDEVDYVDITLILLYSGMRISELLDMKKENVHLDERYMIGGVKTEAGMNRIIPIHKRIVPLIEKRINESTKEYLFINTRGNKLQYPLFQKRYFPCIMDLLKTDHTVHDTRHTFISELDRLNVNQLIIKRIVGHATSDVTHHYTHKNLNELLEAVDRIE